jgi:hypothetical protein
VHDGTTVTDFDTQERDRGITIFAAAVSCDRNGYRSRRPPGVAPPRRRSRCGPVCSL